MPNKESPKKSGFLKEVQNSVKKEFFREGLVRNFFKLKKAIIDFIKRLKKIRNVSRNNYELGRKHYALGNFPDAIMRLKIVTWMDPEYAEGWYWLGASYIAEDKKQAACKALRKAIELKPSWQEARDMLKVASSVDQS